MNDKIYDILMDQDEITWKDLILQLIRSEEMDPWDINISELSKKFIQTIKKLKELNIAISGKVLLAAALLLRIKSTRLVGEDLMEFDRLLASTDKDDLYADDDDSEDNNPNVAVNVDGEEMKLIPRTPQPRKRKVSVYDLLDALAQALNVKKRRVLSQVREKEMSIPEKKIDLSKLMDQLYNEVVEYLYCSKSGKMPFSKLVPSEEKHDKVLTFIPILHLSNSHKIDLDQEGHFGEIWMQVSKGERKVTVDYEEYDEDKESKKKEKRKKRREELAKKRDEKEQKKLEQESSNVEDESVKEENVDELSMQRDTMSGVGGSEEIVQELSSVEDLSSEEKPEVNQDL